MSVPIGAEENWRPAPGFDGYEVSDHGRVISHQKREARVLRDSALHSGHRKVSLRRGGRNVTTTVHRLVAEAFIGPRPEGMQVRHLDGNPANNLLSNLTYGTPSENTHDMVRHGSHLHARKDACKAGHPFTEDNTYYWRGRRKCRACRATRSHVNYLARKAAA